MKIPAKLFQEVAQKRVAPHGGHLKKAIAKQSCSGPSIEGPSIADRDPLPWALATQLRDAIATSLDDDMVEVAALAISSTPPRCPGMPSSTLVVAETSREKAPQTSSRTNSAPLKRSGGIPTSSKSMWNLMIQLMWSSDHMEVAIDGTSTPWLGGAKDSSPRWNSFLNLLSLDWVSLPCLPTSFFSRVMLTESLT